MRQHHCRFMRDVGSRSSGLANRTQGDSSRFLRFFRARKSRSLRSRVRARLGRRRRPLLRPIATALKPRERLLRKHRAEPENFRPGTLEKWGLGCGALKRLNSGAILVRMTAYGQDGPMSSQPGFARVAHAFSGLSYLAGMPGDTPVGGSTSLADYMTGMYGAIGAQVALQARQARTKASASISRSTSPYSGPLMRSRPPFRSLGTCASVWARTLLMSALIATTNQEMANGSRSPAPATRCSRG